MSSLSPALPSSVLSLADLAHWFRQGEKPSGQEQIGSEHELLVLDSATFRRLPFERLEALLHDLAVSESWDPVMEQGRLIGLTRGLSGVSLEPGGQLELSTAPHPSLHAVVEETEAWHQALRSLQEKHHCVFVAAGLDPLTLPDTVPWVPKSRYALMRQIMPRTGSLGLDMMGCTATVQVNLDYHSEEDMGQKVRVALALQPFVSAFFLSSPVRHKQHSGWASFRQHIWTDTDPHRTGIPPLYWPDGGLPTYEALRDYALDVPLYFLKRGEQHCPVQGSFRDLMDHTPDGSSLTVQDWANHLGTLFPEVRVKQYLEMRAADSVPPPLVHALPALWTGLLYDKANLATWLESTRSWTRSEVLALREQISRQGWHGTVFRDHPVRTWCQRVLESAAQGLERRARFRNGQPETVYLHPLWGMVLSGETFASTMASDITFLDQENLVCEFFKPLML